jgi:hypothetical protein
MKIQTRKPAKAALLLALLLLGVAPLRAQFNFWISTNSGKWEVGTNWSPGTPPSTNDFYDNIFGGSTVTIDATTSHSFPNTMTVNSVALETSVLPEVIVTNAAGTVYIDVAQYGSLTLNGALVYYNEVLQLDPNSPYAASARQRIEDLKPRVQASTAN